MRRPVIQGSLVPLVCWGLGCANGRLRGGVAAQCREVVGRAGIEWGLKEAVGNGCGIGERGFANVNWEEVS